MNNPQLISDIERQFAQFSKAKARELNCFLNTRKDVIDKKIEIEDIKKILCYLKEEKNLLERKKSIINYNTIVWNQTMNQEVSSQNFSIKTRSDLEKADQNIRSMMSKIDKINEIITEKNKALRVAEKELAYSKKCFKKEIEKENKFIEENTLVDKSHSCLVCLEDYNEDIIHACLTTCGNQCCKECLEKVSEDSKMCPTCRAPFTKENIL